MPHLTFRQPLMMILLCLLNCLLPTGGHQAEAAEPPSEPILRLETGMHMAMIRRIGVDRAEKTVVTGSDDKTVRVWDLASGQLRQTLRLPIDKEKDGMVFAVAISPDGKTVAAGGWTGWNWDGKASIYLFDLPSESITKRLSGLENVINHLAFSPDGRFLTATLERGKGLRVYRTADWNLAGEDRDYGEASYRAAFDQARRLVTPCYDGYLRLYDPSFKLLAKAMTPGEKKPFGVAFSPDGSRIAVGYSYSTKVDVFSAKDLAHLFAADTAGVDNGDLLSVAWSREGQLLAGGRYGKNDQRPIRRWEKGGQGAFRDLDGASSTIVDLLPISDGRTLFAAADPAWGLLKADGQRERFIKGQVAEFRAMYDQFQLAGDGKTVQFGYEIRGKQPATFAVPIKSCALASAPRSPRPTPRLWG